MHLYQGKKKNITIKYKENTSNLEIEPYETLSYLKNILMRIYPEITLNEYNLIYQNKEIPKNDGIRIDEIFKGKKNIIEIIKKNINKEEKNDNLIKDKCKCNNGYVTNFCRKCNYFICSNCKKLLHSEHKTIPIEIDNFSENIKFYSIQLQSEISDCLNKYKEIENMFNNNLLIDFFSWKEIIIRKLDKIELLFNKFEDFKLIFQNKFENVEKMCIDLTKEIDKNINEISWKSLNNKKTKNIEITYKEIKDYFTKLSENESPIIILENEIESRKEEFETNKKINEIFLNLEKTFDEMEKLSNKSYEIIKSKIGEMEENNKNKNNLKRKSYEIELIDDNRKGNIFHYNSTLKYMKNRYNKNVLYQSADFQKEFDNNLKNVLSSDRKHYESKKLINNYNYSENHGLKNDYSSKPIKNTKFKLPSIKAKITTIDNQS